MFVRLKSFGLSSVLGLALLAGVFVLGSCPVWASDDAGTVPPSQSVEVASVQVLGFVERLEACVAEGRPIESCIEKPHIDSPAPESDQHASAATEADTPAETEPPLAQTGAAIIVEITQSVTIAGSVETGADQVAEEEHHHGVTDEHEVINFAPAVEDDEAPIGEAAAAIVMEITQSVTIAVPGQVVDDSHEVVDVAAAPDDEE